MANLETMNQFYINALQHHPENYINDLTVNRAAYWGIRSVFETLGRHGEAPDTTLLDVVTTQHGDRTAYAVTEAGITPFSLASWRLIGSNNVPAITFAGMVTIHQTDEFDVAYVRA
jgi:hypothetical protein